MPRKTKDTENVDVSKKKTAAKKVAVKKATVKKAPTKKKTTTEKVTKKPVAKKSTAKKSTATKSKTATPKKTTTKKTAVAKKTTKKTAVKKTTSKKATTTRTKTATKKVTKTTTKKVTKKAVVTNNLEYYDLPYRYNQTIVKVLAQTPTNLFIYWDISDADRENFKKQFGENFFETTKPILKVYNDTLHYDFEVEINDFANSWYLPINDSKCDYRVELARRPINSNSNISQDYIYISSSNEIETPNDKILFNVDEKMVYFRNVKTNKNFTKSFANLSFIKNMGKIYNIYDLYKKIYSNEDLEDLYNPSSKFF